MEEKSKYKELNGIKAEEFLEKARTIFQELDLQWELDELDKITLTGWVPPLFRHRLPALFCENAYQAHAIYTSA